jgi:hypothetical protein
MYVFPAVPVPARPWTTAEHEKYQYVQLGERAQHKKKEG